MVMNILGQHERERQASQGLTNPIGSVTSTETTQATLKASEIGFFYPNMPLNWGDKETIEKDGKLYY